jgi:hypothetical protein
MTKIAGSGSNNQRHGSADPDPPQNVMDPEHWHREEGMRLYRHLLDMLTEVERLRTGGSNPSSRTGLHTDALIQVSKLAVRITYLPYIT